MWQAERVIARHARHPREDVSRVGRVGKYVTLPGNCSRVIPALHGRNHHFIGTNIDTNKRIPSYLVKGCIADHCGCHTRRAIISYVLSPIAAVRAGNANSEQRLRRTSASSHLQVDYNRLAYVTPKSAHFCLDMDPI